MRRLRKWWWERVKGWSVTVTQDTFVAAKLEHGRAKYFVDNVEIRPGETLSMLWYLLERNEK